MSARIAYTNADILISCPVENWRAVEAFVNELKRIPSRQRKWLAETKLWRVSLVYEAVALRHLDHYFGGHVVVDLVELQADDEHHILQRHPLADPHRVLFVTPDAPPEVIKAAYRALTKLHHPDVGGNTARMQAINAAAARLLGEK